LIAFLTFQSVSFAQTKELKIGQQVPDLTFPGAYNYKTNETASFKFSDLKGKYVIIDFWGTSCETCLEEFPTLDSLQRLLHDQIQIIAVNLQSKAIIDKFFKTHRMVYRPDLPFITADTTLIKMFPHMGSPYEIWIDKTGKVVVINPEGTINIKKVRSLIANNLSSLRTGVRNVYVDNLFDKRWSDLVQYSSVLLKKSEMNKSGLYLEVPEENGLCEAGSILDLYTRAYNGPADSIYQFYKPKRDVLEVKDINKYTTDLKSEARSIWQDNNTYVYQLTVPKDFTGDKYDLMKQDLDRYFKLKSFVEKRLVKCYVLVRTSLKDKLHAKGGTPKDNFYPMTEVRAFDLAEPRRYLLNSPFNRLVNMVESLVEYQLKMPFIDSTGYSGNIDITVNGDVLDKMTLAKWKDVLKKYDLDLVERECPVPMLIIREEQTSNHINN